MKADQNFQTVFYYIQDFQISPYQCLPDVYRRYQIIPLSMVVQKSYGFNINFTIIYKIIN